MKNIKLVVPASLSGIGEGLDFIEKALTDLGFRPKSIRESMLLSEESMVRLADNATVEATIHISIKKSGGLASIRLSAPGAEFVPGTDNISDFSTGDMGRSSESVIRGILLKAYEDKMRYARKGKYNFVTITAGEREKMFMYRAMAALAISIAAGFVLRGVLSADTAATLNTYLLVPIEEIFINMLMLITAPAVFLSVITSVAQYSSFSDPGRVSIKTLVGYAITSVIAVLAGLLAFNLIQPGSEGQMSGMIFGFTAEARVNTDDVISTIVNIVPSNIIDPFQNLETLQLLFMAIVFGVALGRVGDYSAALRNFIEALNNLITKVISILMEFLPVAIFASVVSMLLNAGGEIIVSLFELLLAVIVGIAIMMVLYCMIIMIGARSNPVTFIKKYAPTMGETFILASGLSALPKTMRCCKKNLGISPKVYSFSIPFGASFNMDGNCVYLTIAGLFMAKMCGVEIFSADILPLILTVLVLSIGAPITPGTALICFTVLLNQLGVSIAAVSILFGVNALIEMLTATSNTAGDVAVSLAIARSENLLDSDVYNSPMKKRK